MRDLTSIQRATLARVAKRPFSIERAVTARALIRAGYLIEYRLAIRPTTGIAVELTAKGRRYVAKWE